MKLKRLLPLALAALMLFSLTAGCGDRSAGGKDDPNTLTITLGVRNVEEFIGAGAIVQDAMLDGNAVYRVVFCCGDYTAELAEACGPMDSGMSTAQIWLDYLESHRPLSPPTVLRS